MGLLTKSSRMTTGYGSLSRRCVRYATAGTRRTIRPVENLRQTFRVVRRVTMHYVGGVDETLDRPAHVRAASGITWFGQHLATVSDDTSFVGLVDPVSGRTQPITIPHAPAQRRQFDTRRGNKADKLDLECVISVEGRLVAFGSDNGLAVRQQVVVIDNATLLPRVVALPRLYEALRQPVLGRGVLNLEGAAVSGDTLVLGNRGGDIGNDAVPTVDAVTRLPVSTFLRLIDDPHGAPLPSIEWHPLHLGHLGGTPLHLTELEAIGDALAFAATAEATTSAYDDGHVTGSVVGWIHGAMSSSCQVEWCHVIDEHGAPLVAKLEGLVFDASTGNMLATVDADDPDRPSELLELAIVRDR